MTDSISEPAREWEYRNFLCRLYRLGDIKILGYVRVGDEWTQAVETERMTADVANDVESEVDRIIREAIREETNKLDFPFDDPIDPNPGIDPIDPNPNPNPYPPNDDPLDPGPTWDYYYGYGNGEDSVTFHSSGIVSVDTGTGSKLVSLSSIDADDITDDGLLDD